MAHRSKSAVNWALGSAQGTGICFTPWMGHATRGTSA